MNDLRDTLLDIARSAQPERQWTQADYERLAVRLMVELVALRERAKYLAYDDIDRFHLSIRAGEIGAELRAITHKTRRAP